MDKRAAKILISCILCTVIVLVLFIVALRFSRMSCELISIDPQHLRQAQLDLFNGNNKKHKPTRSYDKMILMKMSAYLEYNIMQTGSRASAGNEQTGGNNNNDNNVNSFPVASSTVQQQQQQLNGGGALGNQQQQANLNAGAGSPAKPGLTSASTTTTTNQQQLGPSSTFTGANNTTNPSVPVSGGSQQQRASERFLPLYLESIETRSLKPTDGQTNSLVTKQKFILSFNCTKLNMVFAYQGNRVYVESMSLELSPASRQKTTCELQLPSSGAFAVEAPQASLSNNSDLQHANFAHYLCNKALTYNCYHYSSKSGPSPNQGMLLAELHINSIEFETFINSGAKNDNKHKNRHHSHEHKHVEKEFKGKPMMCYEPTDQIG